MKNLENLNLKELTVEEQVNIEGGNEIHTNPDGTKYYTGRNGLVYAGVGLYNLGVYIGKLF